MLNIDDNHVVAAACAAGIMSKANEFAEQALAFQKIGMDELSQHLMELCLMTKAEAEKYEKIALEPLKESVL